MRATAEEHPKGIRGAAKELAGALMELAEDGTQTGNFATARLLARALAAFSHGQGSRTDLVVGNFALMDGLWGQERSASQRSMRLSPAGTVALLQCLPRTLREAAVADALGRAMDGIPDAPCPRRPLQPPELSQLLRCGGLHVPAAARLSSPAQRAEYHGRLQRRLVLLAEASERAARGSEWRHTDGSVAGACGVLANGIATACGSPPPYELYVQLERIAAQAGGRRPVELDRMKEALGL